MLLGNILCIFAASMHFKSTGMKKCVFSLYLIIHYFCVVVIVVMWLYIRDSITAECVMCRDFVLKTCASIVSVLCSFVCVVASRKVKIIYMLMKCYYYHFIIDICVHFQSSKTEYLWIENGALKTAESASVWTHFIHYIIMYARTRVILRNA